MNNPVTSLLKSLVSLKPRLHECEYPAVTGYLHYSFDDIEVSLCLLQHLLNDIDPLEPMTTMMSRQYVIDTLLPNYLSAWHQHRDQYTNHGYQLDDLVCNVIKDVASSNNIFMHQPINVWHDAMEKVLWLGCFASELQKQSTTIHELELGGYEAEDIYAKYCLLTPLEACVIALQLVDRESYETASAVPKLVLLN